MWASGPSSSTIGCVAPRLASRAAPVPTIAPQICTLVQALRLTRAVAPSGELEIVVVLHSFCR
jgi:hypothetical protein